MHVKPAFPPLESMFFRPSYLVVQAGAFGANLCMLRQWAYSLPPHRWAPGAPAWSPHRLVPSPEAALPRKLVSRSRVDASLAKQWH